MTRSLRSMVDGHKAADRADLPARSTKPALPLALSLVEVYRSFHGWPAIEDHVARREREAALTAWNTLRMRWRRTHPGR